MRRPPIKTDSKEVRLLVMIVMLSAFFVDENVAVKLSLAANLIWLWEL